MLQFHGRLVYQLVSGNPSATAALEASLPGSLVGVLSLSAYGSEVAFILVFTRCLVVVVVDQRRG